MLDVESECPKCGMVYKSNKPIQCECVKDKFQEFVGLKGYICSRCGTAVNFGTSHLCNATGANDKNIKIF